MKISHRISAPDGGAFTRDAFDGQVGREIALRVGEKVLRATVAAVTVEPGGFSAKVTLDVPEAVAELLREAPWNTP